jgi:glutamyl-tRNA synthetase
MPLIDQQESKKTVRVRFAPSPTGYLHIGSVRTALFNWLFARQHNGQFILRIEDTDKERSRPEYERDILFGLQWLGLNWDEGPVFVNDQDNNSQRFIQKPPYIGNYGPYRQSERLLLYEQYLSQLLRENKAYWCFCSKEQLELDRQAMLAEGLAPRYSGRCRFLSTQEVEKRLNNKEPAVIRFRVPSAEIEFNDLIRGKVKFKSDFIGDIVIAKSLHEPLFIFVVTVDDHLMHITHIIRGEDHISNTPKQILLQKALGFRDIYFAHLPLILAPDKSKLSKRQLDTALNDYRKNGYLPEAIINFVALLGWHSVEDKEIFNLNELIQEFDLKRVQKAGAIFNIDKLNWLNAQYIKKIDSDQLLKKISEFVPSDWLEKKELLKKVIDLEKERMVKLSDFKNLAEFFFVLPDYDPQLLFWPRGSTASLDDKEKLAIRLQLLYEEINKISPEDFSQKAIYQVIFPLTESWGRGELLWPLRVALSGKEASPGPFEIMEVLGKEEVLARLKKAMQKINF